MKLLKQLERSSLEHNKPIQRFSFESLENFMTFEAPLEVLKPFDLEIVKNMSLRNSWTLSPAVLESKTLFDLKLVRKPLKIFCH